MRSTVWKSVPSSTRRWWPVSVTSQVPASDVPASELCGGSAGGGAPPGGEEECLAREAQGARGGFRRHVGAVAAVQGALGLVLGDQFGDEHGEAVGVAFAGQVGHDVALGVDDHQGGPGAGGVGLPGVQLGIVQDRVVDLVALHGGGKGYRICLVLELGRVHADGYQDVGVLLFERAQLIQDVQAVDAAEGPEVQQHDLAAQGLEVQGLPAGVQPVTAHQFGGAYPELGAYGFAHQRPSSLSCVQPTWRRVRPIWQTYRCKR